MLKKWIFQSVILSMFLIPANSFGQSSFVTDTQGLLSVFVSYTDLRIKSVQQSLEILASTSEVKSLDWKKMRDLFSGFQNSDKGLIVWFVLLDGEYYTVDRGLMKVKLSDRSYFPDIMAGRKVIGSLVVSKSTGRRSAVITVPVQVDGKVVGAVGATIFLDTLSDQIASALSLRKETTFFALAPNGLTALHNKKDRHLLDPRDLGSETLRKAANEMLSRTQGEVTYEYENVRKKAIFRTSGLTHWKFAIAFSDVPGK
jgi:hypothetical protein